MAISSSLTSTGPVTRAQYQRATAQRSPVAVGAQSEPESPAPGFAADNDLGQPNIDGTGATFSILV